MWVLAVTLFDWQKTTTLSFWHLSKNEYWVPETSRRFQYWQEAAPIWRPLPRLANPGNPAMSPHAEGKTGTRYTDYTMEWEGGRAEHPWRSAPTQNAHCKHYPCNGCQHFSVWAHVESWRICTSKHRWLPRKCRCSLLLTPLNCIYSGTPLIRPPTVHGNLAVLTGWPHYQGMVKFHDWST